jgi:hypothetical protein
MSKSSHVNQNLSSVVSTNTKYSFDVTFYGFVIMRDEVNNKGLYSITSKGQKLLRG